MDTIGSGLLASQLNTHQLWERVRDQPVSLYPDITKTSEAVSVMDDLYYPVYKVTTSLRERLISRELHQQLLVSHKRSFSSFSKPPSPESRRLMSLAVYSETKTTGGLGIGSATHLQSKKWITQEASGGYKLSEPENTDTGTRLALFNTNSTSGINVRLRRDKMLKLKAESGVILEVDVDEKGKKNWKTEVEYNTALKQRATNPLLIDIAPDEDQAVAVKGELFLPPKAVQELVSNQYGSEASPFLCEHEPAMHEVFCRLLVRDHLNLLIASTTSEHIAAVRMIRDANNNIFIYIHETLGPGNDIGRATGELVVNTAICNFSNYPVYLLRPGFTLQKDASCCTQFALEAFEAFESNSEELDGWVAKTSLSQQAVISVPSRKVRRVRSVQGKGREESAAINLQEPKFQVSALETPGILLMGSQNKDLFDSSQQSNDKLSQPLCKSTKKTLQQHFEEHTRMIGSSQVNLYITGTRYKSILDWWALKQESQQAVGGGSALSRAPEIGPLLSPVEGLAEPPQSEQTPEEPMSTAPVPSKTRERRSVTVRLITDSEQSASSAQQQTIREGLAVPDSGVAPSDQAVLQSDSGPSGYMTLPPQKRQKLEVSAAQSRKGKSKVSEVPAASAVTTTAWLKREHSYAQKDRRDQQRGLRAALQQAMADVGVKPEGSSQVALLKKAIETIQVQQQRIQGRQATDGSQPLPNVGELLRENTELKEEVRKLRSDIQQQAEASVQSRLQQLLQQCCVAVKRASDLQVSLQAERQKSGRLELALKAEQGKVSALETLVGNAQRKARALEADLTRVRGELALAQSTLRASTSLNSAMIRTQLLSQLPPETTQPQSYPGTTQP